MFYIPTIYLEQLGIFLRNDFQQNVHNVVDERESIMSLLLHLNLVLKIIFKL